MRPHLLLSLATSALVAQAPAAPTPAQKLAADLRALDALRQADPVEAFGKLRALIPTARPAFDRSSLQSAFTGIREWNGQLDVYRAAYDTGVAAGRFEEAREIAGKARDMAADLQKEALAAFNAYKATWQKAGEESLQALTELKELQAKADAKQFAPAAAPKPDSKLSMEDANFLLLKHAEGEQQKVQTLQRLAFLKANEATLQSNVEKAKTVMAPLERPLKDMEARTRGFEEAVAQWDKYILEESADIAGKYKGSRSTYAAGLLRGVAPRPDNRDAALVALQRAAFLDPKNPAIPKRIAQLKGGAAAAPSKGKARKG